MRKLGILLALFAFALMQGRAVPVLADIATTIERASGLHGMTDIKAFEKTTRRKSPRKKAPPPVLVSIPQFIPNEVLVLVTSDQADAVGDELAATFNMTKVETVPIALLEGSIVRFRYPDNRPLSDVINALTSDPRVSQAQPNNYYHPAGKKKRSK